MMKLTLFGFSVTLRPTALLSGVLSALVTAIVTRNNRAVVATGAGLLWYVADATHVAGHIISSQAVDAPMDGIDFGLYPKSVYHNNEVSPQQHIGRSVGGLSASLVATLACTLLARLVGHRLAKKLLTIAAIQNGSLVLLSMAPVPFVDGGVILANLRKLNA